MGKNDPILILGQRPDPHIDLIEAKIEAMGHRPVILDRWESSQGITIQFGGSGKRAGWIHSSEGVFDFNDFLSVWWRVKPARTAEFGYNKGDLEEVFAHREWMEVLRSLSFLMKEAYWVNPIVDHIVAGRKPWQLALATKVGLTCPKTIITNRNESVLAGFPEHIPIIYKTLSSFIHPPDEIVFTNEVSRVQIQQSKAEIAFAPGIFQHKLSKRHEVRVTVVGKEVFSAGIDSQSAGTTGIDWRRDQGRDMYFLTELSSTTKEKLLAFHKNAGLVYATYDFVVTPEGEEIFLECNPGGQWLWLEDSLGLTISSSLAKVLTRGRNN